MWFMSGEKGERFFEIRIKNTRNVSIMGIIRIPIETAGAFLIAYGASWLILNSLNFITRVIMITPRINEPVSPMKILFFFPKTLKKKNAIKLPAKLKHMMPYSVWPETRNQEPKTAEMMMLIPEAKPSIPSIRLNALIIAIIINNVIAKLIVKLISYNPKTPCRLLNLKLQEQSKL